MNSDALRKASTAILLLTGAFIFLANVGAIGSI